MSVSSEHFADWACDPKRSLEERFGAELLIENTIGLWKKKQGIEEQTNFEADILRRKERALDPAYEPRFSREDAEHTQEVLPQVKQFNVSHFDDRPLRDLSVLRFCPPLETIELRHSEIRDWSPIGFQTAISKLHVWGDDKARDLRPLGQLARVESMRLYFGSPWLDMRGWERLGALRELHFHGNILNMREIPALPQLRHLELHHGSGHSICLRTVADLPEMPELRRLFLENTAELAGIERYPELLNLTVYGYFTDLTPLAGLKELTHLMISGGDYPSIAPVSKLPQLCRLVVAHEIPPDFTPLADAPRLHEAVMEISTIVPPELASLNAMCAPWSDEFAAPQPRPLGSLRLFVRDPQHHPEKDCDAPPRDWGDNEEMNVSEGRWFAREINRRFDALLGQGWGRQEDCSNLHGGYAQVTINRSEDIDRLPAIVQCLRELMASARHPWNLLFMVKSLERYERDIQDIYRDDDEEFNAEREREEWEYRKERQREHRQYLERKYKHRLQQELGLPATPDNPAAPAGEADDDALETTADESGPEFDLGTELELFTTLTEKGVYFHESYRGLAEMLLEKKAEM
jgi:hypothetical protein